MKGPGDIDGDGTAVIPVKILNYRIAMFAGAL
jgi:hypothetical protein